MSVEVYSQGLVATSVCAPKSYTREEVEAEVNRVSPSGVTPWRIAEDENFAGGEPIPYPCEHNSDRQHWLLHC